MGRVPWGRDADRRHPGRPHARPRRWTTQPRSREPGRGARTPPIRGPGGALRAHARNLAVSALPDRLTRGNLGRTDLLVVFTLLILTRTTDLETRNCYELTAYLPTLSPPILK